MSYHTWTDYGYGIDTDDIIGDVTVERLQKLISMAPEFNKKVEEYFGRYDIENPDLDDYFDCDLVDGYSLSGIIKEVINELEDVRFSSFIDYDGADYLVFEPMYPWSFCTEKEKNLTMTDVDNIINKYVSIISDEKYSIDYQEIHNGG